MDRGAWWATVRGVTESDMPETTEHACMHVYNARTDLYVVLCVCLCMRIYVCADLCVVVCVCVCVCADLCVVLCVCGSLCSRVCVSLCADLCVVLCV